MWPFKKKKAPETLAEYKARYCASVGLAVADDDVKTKTCEYCDQPVNIEEPTLHVIYGSLGCAYVSGCSQINILKKTQDMLRKKASV